MASKLTVGSTLLLPGFTQLLFLLDLTRIFVLSKRALKTASVDIRVNHARSATPRCGALLRARCGAYHAVEANPDATNGTAIYADQLGS